MADMKLFIELLARSSGLKTGLDDSGRAVNRFVQGARRELDALKRTAGSLGGKLAALGLSVGAVQQLSQSARLDKGLTQIKQTAGESAQMVGKLRREFFEMSRQTGRDVEGMKGGFDSLIQSGQSWRAALESTRGITIANAVTGADEKTLSGGLTVGATAFNIDLEKQGRALELLDKMTVAGRLGNAELENLSGIFARVGVNAASAGMSFDKTLAFIEALSMVERQPERLATLADSTLRLFTNLRYMKEAQKATGVKFFDAQGTRRDAVAVLQDIKAHWDKLQTDKDRALFVQKAFGKADLDTIKGMKTLLQGDSLNKIQTFTTQIGQAGGTLQRDLPDAVNNAVDQAGRLKGVLRQAADEFVQPINRMFSDMVRYGLDTKRNGGMELSGKQILGGGAAILGGTYLAARLGNGAIKGIAGRMLRGVGGTAVGVAEGKALQAAAGVTPVFVTNWPGAGISGTNPGSGSGPFNPTEWGGSPRTTGPIVRNTAGKALPWVVASGPMAIPPVLAGSVSLAARMIGENQARNEVVWRSDKDLALIRAQQMVMGGGPKSFQVKAIDEELSRRWKEQKNEIKIDINIDGVTGRTYTATNGMNNKINVMKRGSFFDAMMSTKGMGY